MTGRRRRCDEHDGGDGRRGGMGAPERHGPSTDENCEPRQTRYVRAADARSTAVWRCDGGATAVRWRQTDGGCDDKGGSGTVVGGRRGSPWLFLVMDLDTSIG